MAEIIDDVRYDPQALDAAVAAARAALSTLEAQNTARHRLADIARTQWSGKTRDEFEAAYGTLSAKSAVLAGELTRLIAALGAAHTYGDDEQARRERARYAYQRKKEEEQSAAARKG